MKNTVSSEGATASERISARIADLGGWRGAMLARVRALILGVDAGVIEEWKWMGTPVWSCDGILCTGESYKEVVKLTFAHGASLPDPKKLFNSSLDGNVRRAIDLREGDVLDERALRALLDAAIQRNRAKLAAKKPVPKKAVTEKAVPKKASPNKPVPKKAVAKKAVGEKASPKKAVAKKAVAKKTPSKKA